MRPPWTGMRVRLEGLWGAVAPMAGALTGPVGTAVGTGINLAMKRLSTYDSVKKNEAMGHMNQVAQVALAGKGALK